MQEGLCLLHTNNSGTGGLTYRRALVFHEKMYLATVILRNTTIKYPEKPIFKSLNQNGETF